LGKKINANQILILVYGDNCPTKQTVHIWCKKMLDGQKFVSNTEVQSVVLQWHEQQPASLFTSDIQKFALVSSVIASG